MLLSVSFPLPRIAPPFASAFPPQISPSVLGCGAGMPQAPIARLSCWIGRPDVISHGLRRVWGTSDLHPLNPIDHCLGSGAEECLRDAATLNARFRAYLLLGNASSLRQVRCLHNKTSWQTTTSSFRALHCLLTASSTSILALRAATSQPGTLRRVSREHGRGEKWAICVYRVITRQFMVTASGSSYAFSLPGSLSQLGTTVSAAQSLDQEPPPDYDFKGWFSRMLR